MNDEQLKDEARRAIREMMPDIPLPDQEEMADQVMEMVAKHGVMRVATIGRVAEKILTEAIDETEE